MLFMVVHIRTTYLLWRNVMKKLSYLLILSGLISVPAIAGDSPHTLSGNVSLTSDYVFRGISQTGGDMAIQGGLDYTHASGIYVGTWASNVGWIEDYQGYNSGNVEIDLYGGYRGSLGDMGVSYDVGAIRYMYPGERGGSTDANTTEIYGSVGWKWFTAKYSYYISEGVFGFGNADGSDYLDISASLPIGDTGLTLGAHWGTFSFDNNSPADYNDWKISATYDLGKLSNTTSGMTLGVAYTDTDARKAVWTDANGEYLGDNAFFVWISKSL